MLETVNFSSPAFSNIRIVDKSLVRKATETIRDLIVNGECEMGTRLLENDLSEALGISRTCVRESFLLLQNEGLIVSNPNKSNTVRVFTKKDVEDIYTLRAILEVGCLEYSMNNDLLDVETLFELSRTINENYNNEDSGLEWIKDDLKFHEFLLGCSKNEYAMNVWKGIKFQLLFIFQVAYKRAKATKRHVLVPADGGGSHDIIVNHIINNNAKLAKKKLNEQLLFGAKKQIVDFF